MKDINFLTVLSLLQFFYIIYLLYTRPELGVDSVDIIWSIYFYSNIIIFTILMCADVIYTKVR